MTNSKHSTEGESGRQGGNALPPDQRSTRGSQRRKWCFRLTALLLPISLVIITELLLVAFGVGNDLSLFVRVRGNPEILEFQVNPRAEESYFAGRSLAGPEPKRFDLPKPDGVYRIVVVGGSTVLGFPYPPELSFPRQLQVLLNEQNADERFEVLNTGMVAINSFSVADIVKQSVAMRPDLIIVHTGHNEFYGPGGVASTTSMVPLATKIRRRRLFQLIASLFVEEPTDRRDLMEELPASVTIPQNGPEFQKAEEYYRENLEQIVATATAANIPIVLTTMASNLRDHSPVSFNLPEQLASSSMEQWRTFFDRGRQLAVEKDWQNALEQLGLAEAISGDSALLHYRMGQCYEALKKYSQSRREFEIARDIDGCRFRAPSSFRGIVRSVAAQATDSNVYFVDSAERLATETGPATLGYNFFLEHVHYNLAGHRKLATILGQFVQANVLHRQWDAGRIPEEEEFDKLLGLLPEDRVSGLSYGLKVMTVFPMSKTFDVNLHKEAIVNNIQKEIGKLEAERQQMFAELSLDDMAMRLAAALADSYRSTGQLEKELFYRRCDYVRRPWDPDVTFRLARCLAESGSNVDGAISLCGRTLKLSPQHTMAGKLLAELKATGKQ